MKGKIYAVIFFAFVLLLWIPTIDHDTLGFVAPVSFQAFGGDLWVALMWLLFAYACQNLYRNFRKAG